MKTAILDLINNDQLASSCQSLGQYRTLLANHAHALAPTDAKALCKENERMKDALRKIIENHGQWNNGIWASRIASEALKGGAA